MTGDRNRGVRLEFGDRRDRDRGRQPGPRRGHARVSPASITGGEPQDRAQPGLPGAVPRRGRDRQGSARAQGREQPVRRLAAAEEGAAAPASATSASSCRCASDARRAMTAPSLRPVSASPDFRNFDELDWRPAAGWHCCSGANGAGKTHAARGDLSRRHRQELPHRATLATARRDGEDELRRPGRGRAQRPLGARARRSPPAGASATARTARPPPLAEHLAVLPVVAWSAAERELLRRRAGGAPALPRSRGAARCDPARRERRRATREPGGRSGAPAREARATRGSAELEAWNELLARPARSGARARGRRSPASSSRAAPSSLRARRSPTCRRSRSHYRPLARGGARRRRGGSPRRSSARAGEERRARPAARRAAPRRRRARSAAASGRGGRRRPASARSLGLAASRRARRSSSGAPAARRSLLLDDARRRARPRRALALARAALRRRAAAVGDRAAGRRPAGGLREARRRWDARTGRRGGPTRSKAAVNTINFQHI